MYCRVDTICDLVSLRRRRIYDERGFVRSMYE